MSNPKFFRPQLGEYRVGTRLFQNKIEALLACGPGETPHWQFMERALSSEDLTREPAEDLYELYRQRAWQLREQYDYLVLMFSGGIDSYTVLRTFVDNQIPLDGIVTYGSFQFHGWQKMTRNAEAHRVALPLIRRLKNRHGGKINHHMLNDWDMYSNFQDESWVLSTGNGQLSPEAYVFNFHWQDPFLQDFLSRGNTALIRGVDKPRIIREGREWQLIFIDATTYGVFPSGVDPRTNHYYGSEYFFWTEDMPRLLAKQAHVIRQGFLSAARADPQRPSEYWRDLLSLDHKRFRQREYTKWIDPFVYGRYVDQRPGQERPYFTLGKSPNNNSWIRDHAFFEHGDPKQIEGWRKGIEYCIDRVDTRFLNAADYDSPQDRFRAFVKSGFRAFVSQAHTFALDSDDDDDLFGQDIPVKK